MKKSFVIGVTWLFLGIIVLSIGASEIPKNATYEKLMSTGRSNEDLTGILTHGPYAPFLNIATITIAAGDPEQIEKIKRILYNRILQQILLEQKVDVTGLDFSVTYNWDIPQSSSLVINWIFLRVRYNTYVTYNGNETSIGYVKHTIIVKGFEGEFSIGRAPFFRFFPPQFVFNGTCQEAVIITLS